VNPSDLAPIPIEFFSPKAWGVGILAVCVLLGALPVLAGLFQFLLIALSYFNQHVVYTRPHWPRISVIVPAWNEGAVIGLSIDRLMQLNYPKDRLRVYLIDDGSTDETPRIAIEKSKQYP
jgi:cellulose synthase/poly-beta-1,6-N-acetylglucosamine synthase-like glycosyltransferase